MEAAGRLPRGARRDDREVPGGPARVRAALRPLLLPRQPRPRRWNAGSARIAATTAATASTSTQLREAVRQAIAEGRDGEMRDLARLAIAAFGRRGEGSGVIGVDVQRIRRTLGLQTQQAHDADEPALDRDQINRFERHLRRELERALIERTEKLPPSRPLAELDRALPTSPTQDLAAVHRAVTQLKRRLATRRPRAARASQGSDRRRAPNDARLARNGRRTASAQASSQAPAPTRDLRAVRRLDLGHVGERLLPLGAARPARLVPKAAELRLHRADLRGHRRVRAASGTSARSRSGSAARAASPTSRATPTTAGSGSSSSRRSSTTSAHARR